MCRVDDGRVHVLACCLGLLAAAMGCSGSDDTGGGGDGSRTPSATGDGDGDGDGDGFGNGNAGSGNAGSGNGGGGVADVDAGGLTPTGSLTFDCSPLCSAATIGPAGGAAGGGDFDLAMDPNERVEVGDDGALQLNRIAGPAGPSIIWIADRGFEHTVLKVDTETMQQLGRYRVGPDGQEDPSRTAVDRDGNVYVGNRGGEDDTWRNRGLMSITKVINQDCPDQNGDGIVTTSTGPNDVLPWGEDECVAWHVPFPHDVRAIAAQDIPSQVIPGPDGNTLIPAERYVWVSGMNGSWFTPPGEMATLRKLDAATGATVLEFDIYPAYGMALDGRGNLWLDRAVAGGGLQRIDLTQCVDAVSCDVPYCENTCTETACTDQNDGCAKQLITGFPGGQGYGITVDLKQRVWLGGWVPDRVKIYDQLAPADQRFRDGLIPGINGIAADANGFIWGARIDGDDWVHPNTGTTLTAGVVRIDAETLDAVMAAPGNAKGMAIDRQGKVWSISQRNYATVIEPGPTLTDNTVSRPVDNLSSPYTYSDMTGQQTRLANGDPGSYTRLFEGCETGETTWQELAWDADIPADSRLRFSVRAADSIAELQNATYSLLANAPPDTSPRMLPASYAGKYLEVQVELSISDPANLDLSPKLYGFGVGFACDLLQ